MKNLRRNFERFCYRHRKIGIPNLMLYICLGSGVVNIFSYINGGAILYELLCFDKAAILRGQVWRLVSWLFTEELAGSLLLSLLFLYFFYRLGSAVETSIGTFKFNLFYLGGVVLMDIFALVACPTEATIVNGMILPPDVFYLFYSNMAYYLHLSMVLAFATMYPNTHFMVLFVIPVRAWVIALVDLVMIAISVFNLCYPVMLFPHCLFPLVGLLNYFIFFGADMSNLLPVSWQVKLRRKKKNKASGPRVVPFDAPKGPYAPATSKDGETYTHKCTVCGRTDVSDPELEFRYCSRCNGYHCYCEEHINQHTHVE